MGLGSKSNGTLKSTHVVKIDDPSTEAPCRFISQVSFYFGEHFNYLIVFKFQCYAEIADILITFEAF